MKILLIEDDETLGDGIVSGLEIHGHEVGWRTRGLRGLDAANAEPWDALILDLGLPDLPGLRLLRSLREAGNCVPVLILTARDAIDDRVNGLDAGADDYLVKPFDLGELVARLRALHRRESSGRNDTLTWGDMHLDRISRRVSVGGRPVDLPRREFDLLALFMSAPSKVWSADDIEERLYGLGDGVDSNALAVHIHNLRKKLGDWRIRTIRGVGYQLCPCGA